MTTITLSIDDAQAAAYTASARARGMSLAALVLSLLKKDAAEQQLAPLDAPTDAPLIDAMLQKPLDPVARKGLLALREMGKSAQEAGIADMTLEEINAEIAAARYERDRPRPLCGGQ